MKFDSHGIVRVQHKNDGKIYVGYGTDILNATRILFLFFRWRHYDQCFETYIQSFRNKTIFSLQWLTLLLTTEFRKYDSDFTVTIFFPHFTSKNLLTFFFVAIRKARTIDEVRQRIVTVSRSRCVFIFSLSPFLYSNEWNQYKGFSCQLFCIKEYKSAEVNINSFITVLSRNGNNNVVFQYTRKFYFHG